MAYFASVLNSGKNGHKTPRKGRKESIMGFTFQMRQFVASMLALIVCVLPKIALANAGEDTVRDIGSGVWTKLRGTVLPYVYAEDVDFGILGWILSILATCLTMAWLWKLKFAKGKYDVSNIVGGTIGPFALLGWVVMIGISLAYMAIVLVQGLMTGVSALVGMVVSIVFLIGITVFIAMNIGRLVSEMFETFKGVITGAGGREPRMAYKIAGTLAVCGIINYPGWYGADWPFPLYGLLSVASALLGVYALVATTIVGRRVQKD